QEKASACSPASIITVLMRPLITTKISLPMFRFRIGYRYFRNGISGVLKTDFSALRQDICTKTAGAAMYAGTVPTAAETKFMARAFILTVENSLAPTNCRFGRV